MGNSTLKLKVLMWLADPNANMVEDLCWSKLVGPFLENFVSVTLIVANLVQGIAGMLQ